MYFDHLCASLERHLSLNFISNITSLDTSASFTRPSRVTRASITCGLEHHFAPIVTRQFTPLWTTQRPKLRLAYARRSFTSPGKQHCYFANYSFVGVTPMQSSLLGEYHCTSARTSVHIDFSYLRPSRLSASNFTQFRRPSLPTSLRIVSKRKTLIDRWE